MFFVNWQVERLSIDKAAAGKTMGHSGIKRTTGFQHRQVAAAVDVQIVERRLVAVSRPDLPARLKITS